jgi:Mg-chelatase subunit ChlD
VTAGLLLAILGVGGALVAQNWRSWIPDGDECSDEPSVAVAAAPEISGLIQAAADRVDAGGECQRIFVREDAPASVLADIRAGSNTVPDVWIPDSSTWLAQYDLEEPPVVVAESLAASPTAVVTPGDSDVETPPSWLQLLDSRDVNVGNPLLSSTSLLTLAQLLGEVGDAPRQQRMATVVGLAQGHEMSTQIEPVDAGLYEASEGSLAADEALVTSEQRFVAFERQFPDNGLGMVVPRSGAGVLDYPVLVLPGAGDDARVAAEALVADLTSPRGHEALGRAGFRVTAQTPLDRGRGVGRIQLLPTPDRVRTVELLGTWSQLTMPTRMLAVLDVSGSMEEVDPGTERSRIRIAMESAAQGLALFPDDAEIGLWAFSRNLASRGQDHQVLADIRPLDTVVGALSQRRAVQADIDRLPGLVGGSTGLYDTVLAAWRAVKAGYSPDRVNSVLIITDGRNEDPGGLGLRSLEELLREANDAKHPVSIFAIGIGPEADLDALERIAEATGGRAFAAETAEQIPEVFAQALLARTQDR